MSWSLSSDCILIIGNGKNSSGLLYKLEDVKLQEDDNHKVCPDEQRRLNLLWTARAGLSETRESTVESHDQGNKSHDQRNKSHDRGNKSHDRGNKSHDRGNKSHDQGNKSHDQGNKSHDQGNKSHDQGNKSHDQGNKSHDQLTGRDYSYKDAFYMGEVNPSGTVFIVEEREESCTLLHLLDGHTGLPMKTTPLSSLSGTREAHTLMMSSLHQGLYALMVEGGYVVMVTGEELEIVNIYNIVRFINLLYDNERVP